MLNCHNYNERNSKTSVIVSMNSRIQAGYKHIVVAAWGASCQTGSRGKVAEGHEGVCVKH